MDQNEATAAIVASVATALQADTTKKIYEDLSPVVAQLGKGGESILKVVLSPIHVAASHAEKWVWLVRAAHGQIPEERRLEPAPSIAGQIFENMKHVESGNPLLEFYKNLLSSAMDQDKVDSAHPAFAELIKQLSSDEAVLLYWIRKGLVSRREKSISYPFQEEKGRVERSIQYPMEILARVNNMEMYLQHLDALLLTASQMPVDLNPEMSTDEEGNQCMRRDKVMTIALTRFGKIFAKACVPEQWEIPTVAKER